MGFSKYFVSSHIIFVKKKNLTEKRRKSSNNQVWKGKNIYFTLVTSFGAFIIPYPLQSLSEFTLLSF